MDTPRMTDDKVGPSATAPASGNAPRDATRDDRPRLPPRPLWRPPVSPVDAGTFGRPRGVDGAFGPDAPRVNGAASAAVTSAPPVPEFLADAFGRPVGGGDSIGRAPDGPSADGRSAPAPSDPWRDPMSAAQLGAPAMDPTPPEGPEPLPAERFSFRQALFDLADRYCRTRRVGPGLARRPASALFSARPQPAYGPQIGRAHV